MTQKVMTMTNSNTSKKKRLVLGKAFHELQDSYHVENAADLAELMLHRKEKRKGNCRHVS